MEINRSQEDQKLSLPPMDSLFSMEAKRYGRQRLPTQGLGVGAHCAVTLFEDLRFANGTERYWRKRLPLSNGRLDQTAVAGSALIKILKSNELTSGRGEKDLFLLAVWTANGCQESKVELTTNGRIWESFKHPTNTILPTQGSGVAAYCAVAIFEDLSFITESRVQEVVEAFGTVYKGILPSGSGNSVAERKLEKVVGEGEKEFKAEVNVIGQTHHKNPGRLLGFTAMRVNTDFWCMSSCTMALYQASFSEAPEDLCLNEECSKQIIHCNIKASEHNSWMILLQPKLQTLAGKASDKQPDLNTHRHQRDYGVYSENSGSLYLL
ncbi:G-type lectin S-receptor-like serine/threonine-protein kinase LECRK3 [Vitis vinifera]|uniref:G-type lectin S-receptor-like serine/threonine-protein kinase LECRK3 n=1 Tax=Vitis vinifera TaxID=29760 RepID=UPI00053F984A|nr:G-type lectin S-receptor-like serine/threonine-protein kinase LECRK3 [Vitis vinifera]